MNYNIPFILKNFAVTWNAYDKWNLNYFKDKYGEIIFEVSRTINKNDKIAIKLSEFIDYTICNNEIDPYYLTSFTTSNFLSKSDFKDYSAPVFVENLFNYLPMELQPKYSWIYIGSKNTGSLLHKDVLMTSAWNVLLTGKKFWLFVKKETNLMKKNKEDLFNEFRDSPEMFFGDDNFICFEQNRGDLVYTPSTWEHMVINKEISIAITENFVDRLNIDRVIKFCELMKYKDWYKIFNLLKHRTRKG